VFLRSVSGYRGAGDDGNHGPAGGKGTRKNCRGKSVFAGVVALCWNGVVVVLTGACRLTSTRGWEGAALPLSRRLASSLSYLLDESPWSVDGSENGSFPSVRSVRLFCVGGGSGGERWWFRWVVMVVGTNG
jgi:hypothetical protein